MRNGLDHAGSIFNADKEFEDEDKYTSVNLWNASSKYQTGETPGIR